MITLQYTSIELSDVSGSILLPQNIYLTKHHGGRKNMDDVVKQLVCVDEHGGKAGFGDIDGFGLIFFFLI
jgi:hypothetical protein